MCGLCGNSSNDDRDSRFEIGVLWSVLRQIKKPLIWLAIYCVYYLYVNFFGVVAFFSLNMFIIPLMVLVFAAWGISVSLGLRSAGDIDAKFLKFFMGIFIAVVPFLLYSLRFDINETGVYLKVRQHDKQLRRMCEKILDEKPERMYLGLREYDESDIWAFGARPTRYYGHHENGVVYLDFNGSPDNGSGIIYNPDGKGIKFHESNYHHMFGPWYRFDVNYE